MIGRWMWSLMAMAAVALPLRAQTVTATDPNSVAEALRAAGHSGTVGLDEQGNPKIESLAQGTNFTIYFFDCTEGRNCGAIQFHSSYELTPPPADRFMDWNRGRRYARAFVSEAGHPTVEMDVDLDQGGMSRTLFLDNLELWLTLVPLFEEQIGWREPMEKAD